MSFELEMEQDGVTEDLNDLTRLVLKWAEDRNLIEGSDPKSQFCKLVSEVGELGDSIGKGRYNDALDDLGDCMVVLIILAKQMDHTMGKALAHAYSEIKDRKGRMVNGVFIKEGDNG